MSCYFSHPASFFSKPASHCQQQKEKMATKSGFRVIIAGGSITGLTLANMLQLYNIDFIVLESYSDIAPQVGASIGLLPHGNRIMDQLGLFQKVLDLCPPLDSFHFRDETGNVICEFRGMIHSMQERLGCPLSGKIPII